MKYLIILAFTVSFVCAALTACKQNPVAEDVTTITEDVAGLANGATPTELAVGATPVAP